MPISLINTHNEIQNFNYFFAIKTIYLYKNKLNNYFNLTDKSDIDNRSTANLTERL